MAQNVIIAGVTFPDVPSISVPISGGGDASYVDTSDANATAGDISTGKTAYVNGVKLTGTGTGGGTKYNCSVDDFLGDTDSSGQLQPVTGNKDLVFSTVQSLAAYALSYKFYRNNALKSVKFPALTTCSTSYCMEYAFSASTNILSASFPALTTISAPSLLYTFNGCTALESVDLSALESITGTTAMQNAFRGCTALESVDFSALESITGTTAMQNTFYGCTALESIDFSSLKVIGDSTATIANYRHMYSTFYNCDKLTTITFPSLEHIYCNGTANAYGTFYSNNKVEKFYFPSLKTISKTDGYTVNNADVAAQNIFFNCGSLTEIHFALVNKTTIESSTGYSTKWGAPSTCTIYFDL